VAWLAYARWLTNEPRRIRKPPLSFSHCILPCTANKKFGLSPPRPHHRHPRPYLATPPSFWFLAATAITRLSVHDTNARCRPDPHPLTPPRLVTPLASSIDVSPYSPPLTLLTSTTNVGEAPPQKNSKYKQ
jgi:hypothetical protein